MSRKTPYKPLWRIHNRTYRKYVRGAAIKRWSRYFEKFRRRLAVLHR